MKWNGFDTNPTLFQPVSAKEVKDDGTVLDVAAWREDTTQKLIDIKDEVNDEQAATRQTIIDEHTSTRATIVSEGDQTQGKLDIIEASLTEINATIGTEHTSTRATITAKSDEEQVKLDEIEAAINAEANLTRIVRASVHEQVHDGNAFMLYHNNSSLANGATLNIKLATGTNSTHIVFDIHGKFDFEFKCYEAPSSVNGSAATIFNKNRASSNTSGNTATRDAASISGGTIILHDLISEGQKAGGRVDFDRELILKPSTDYIFEVTSLASSNLAHINLEWYEPS